MSEFSAEEWPPDPDISDLADGYSPYSSHPPDVTIARETSLEQPAYHNGSDPIIVAGSERRGRHTASVESEESLPPIETPPTHNPVKSEATPSVEVIEHDASLNMPSPESVGTLETVSPVTFIGSGWDYLESVNAKGAFMEWLSKRRDNAFFEGASSPADADLNLIAGLSESLLQVGRRLGVDLSARLLRPEHYHFFDRIEDMARARGVEPEDAPGANYKPYQGILSLRDQETNQMDPRLGIFELAHEIGHSLAYHQASVDLRERAWGFTAVGYNEYTLDNNLPTMNMGITELAADIFADRAMSASPEDFRQRPVQPGYLPLDIIGDAVIRETARYSHASPQEIEDTLLKGSLTGDQTGLWLFGEALGAERMIQFQKLTGAEGWNSLYTAAHQLELPRAVTSIEHAYKRQPFEIFSWRQSVLSH